MIHDDDICFTDVDCAPNCICVCHLEEADLLMEGPDNLILRHEPRPPRDWVAEAARGRQEQIDREYGEITGDDGGEQNEWTHRDRAASRRATCASGATTTSGKVCQRDCSKYLR